MDHVLGSRSLFAIPHLCTTSLFIAISTSIDPEAFFRMLENSLHYVWTKRICPNSLLTKKCLRLGCLLLKSILSWKWNKNINKSQCISRRGLCLQPLLLALRRFSFMRNNLFKRNAQTHLSSPFTMNFLSTWHFDFLKEAWRYDTHVIINVTQLFFSSRCSFSETISVSDF